MAKVRDIKDRLKSVTNTTKITKTMELVATAKSKVALRRIENAIPYFKALSEIASEARGQGGKGSHPLLEERKIERAAVLVVVGNRGLCGGYNSICLRTARDHVAELRDQGVEVDLVPSGRKAFGWLRFQGVPFDENGYDQFEDKPQFEETVEVSERFMTAFLKGDYDRVDVVYTHFFSAGRQGPVVETLLPIAAKEESEAEAAEAVGDEENEFLIEPDPETILNTIFPMQVRLHLFRVYLEAAVSEQIARRVAMKNASDNAEELCKSLRMLYNRLRQSQITTEILEIIGGAEALG